MVPPRRIAMKDSIQIEELTSELQVVYQYLRN